MTHDQGVLVQIMNTSPEPVALYKGSRLAMFHRQEGVFIVTDEVKTEDRKDFICNGLSPDTLIVTQ